MLGPVEVIVDDHPVRVPSGRVRELLLRLAVAGAGSVPVDSLVSELWPESAHRTTTSAVRTYVARLRQVLPGDVVVTRVGGYGLDRAQVVVDAEQFDADLRTARGILALDPGQAATLLEAALGRWRGRALDDVADRDWATPIAARLEEARVDALELLAEAQLAAGGDPAGIAARLGELTRAHPLRERLWRHRILALYRSGRQADALACYQEVRDLLLDELGIEPGAELRDLERAVLVQDPRLDEGTTPTPPVTAPDDALRLAPETVDGLTTTLVGRDPEREEVRHRLARGAVVTLTGAGGVGKSRLAREVVGDLAADGHVAVWVDLASVDGGDALVEAVAAALGVVQRGGRDLVELLVDALADTATVLVLDNGEHLAADVSDLLDAVTPTAPRARVLVTSRVALGARSEVVVPLAPLGLPAPEDDRDPAAVAAAEAVQLFEARARVVAPSFAVGPDNAATVARICRQLDGLPFAIELAAARMRVLTPWDIEARLDERFALLTGAREGRHETLREAVAWSYELLDEDERRSFRRLAVFAGPFDVPGAAAAVDAMRDDEIIDVLASLIDRSLLAVESHGAHVRYRMLETVRAFGREQLEAAGELVATRNRHAQYLTRVAVHAGELLHGPREAVGHALLDTLRDDLRAAVEWCLVAGRWSAAARVVTAVPWERVGRWVQWEVTSWAARLVEEAPVLDVRLDARVHGVASVGHWLAGEPERALATGDHALVLAEQVDDDQTWVEVALAVAWVRWEAGDMERAAALYLPMADPSLGDRVTADVAAYCLAGMVMGMVESGLLGTSDDVAEHAHRLTDAAIELAGRSGCPAALALAHLSRAYSLLDADPTVAERSLAQAAAVPGLALPTWALHARAHLARFRAVAGETDGLPPELAAILHEALATVDELHLRMISGFVGGALVMAGQAELAPSLRPLTAEAFTVPGGERWRREVADRMGASTGRPTGPTLSGRALEQAVRTAIEDLSRVSQPAPVA